MLRATWVLLVWVVLVGNTSSCGNDAQNEGVVVSESFPSLSNDNLDRLRVAPLDRVEAYLDYLERRQRDFGTTYKVLNLEEIRRIVQERRKDK